MMTLVGIGVPAAPKEENYGRGFELLAARKEPKKNIGTGGERGLGQKLNYDKNCSSLASTELLDDRASSGQHLASASRVIEGKMVRRKPMYER